MPTRFPAYPTQFASQDSTRGHRHCSTAPRSVRSRRTFQGGHGRPDLLTVAVLVMFAFAVIVVVAQEIAG